MKRYNKTVIIAILYLLSATAIMRGQKRAIDRDIVNSDWRTISHIEMPLVVDELLVKYKKETQQSLVRTT